MNTDSRLYRDQQSTYEVTSKRLGKGTQHEAHTLILHDRSSTYEMTAVHWGMGGGVSH